MRVTSDIFVSALIRRVFAHGGFAAVMRRGAAEAGAVFLVARDRSGEASRFGPAPQAGYGSAAPPERAFVPMPHMSDEDFKARMAREARFDPDFWLVEIEPGTEPVQDLLSIMPT